MDIPLELLRKCEEYLKQRSSWDATMEVATVDLAQFVLQMANEKFILHLFCERKRG